MSGPWEPQDGKAGQEGQSSLLVCVAAEIPVLQSILTCFCSVWQFGSAVKLPGSGGAVVGLCLDNAKLVRLNNV